MNKLTKTNPQFRESPFKPVVNVVISQKIKEYAIKSENKKSQVRKIMD